MGKNEGNCKFDRLESMCGHMDFGAGILTTTDLMQNNLDVTKTIQAINNLFIWHRRLAVRFLAAQSTQLRATTTTSHLFVNNRHLLLDDCMGVDFPCCVH